MPAVRNQGALDDRAASVGKTKFSGETIKQVFQQISINDQRQKLKIGINDIVIECLIYTGVDATIILSKSWHPDCSHQEVNVQLLRTETLSQAKQSSRWVKGTEQGQTENLKPYVTKIAMNLWGCDLLNQ